MSRDHDHDGDGWRWPFVAGIIAGAAGMVLSRALRPRRGLDPRLIQPPAEADVPPTVIVPGIMGSTLMRPDGTPVWLNVRNALGYYSLALPYVVPLSQSIDDLVPGALVGIEDRLPRLFGFTEYADLLELLESAGFRPAPEAGDGLAYSVFGYDWRRDLVESARRLEEALDMLADARGEPGARFNVIGHSMGGLVARYYLRYGTAEPGPDTPITWAGARRMRSLTVVATPNAGSIPALQALLLGDRVGLSYTTLSADIVSRMPSVYELLPPAGTVPLLDERWDPVHAELHDIETWRRFGWGPYAPTGEAGDAEREEQKAFLAAALDRARLFHEALARRPLTHCPVRVSVLGGDCLPTLARCVVPDTPGRAPRFEPASRGESDALYEAGDGRVTRASVLANHLPCAEDSEIGCGLPEVGAATFGAADHHGIYAEPTFQSTLLRTLMRGSERPARGTRPRRRRTTDVVAPVGHPEMPAPARDDHPSRPQVAEPELPPPASSLT